MVLTNPALRGLEYGMLRDFEDEIVRLTGAERVIGPSRSLPKFIGKRLKHGTRYSAIRKWVPKEEYDLNADVLWVVLMGPESFTLDLYKKWDKHVGLKILYFFDTYDGQLPSIRRVLQSTNWDFTSTALYGAKSFLEEETQREWHLVRHAVNLNRFRPAPREARIIDYCAYGRRFEPLHKTMREYCVLNGKYYDYTTTASVQPELDARDHYAQYAWHLSHSIFNFCWPMELTHPDRAKSHSPITCRWFEAAASGNVILGRAPLEPGFAKIFGHDAVIDIDQANGDLPGICHSLWEKRDVYLERALERRQRLASNWSWEARIKQIMSALGLTPEESEEPSAKG
ncbi:MAG: glycosyltransferase [Acidobacteriota bacterium]|nr:glycosyltransferase [Acidobacteriota bacterium]